MKKQLVLVLLSLVLVCTGAFAMGSQEKKPASSDNSMMKSDTSMTKTDDTMMKTDGTATMKDGIFMKDDKIMETMNGKTSGLMMDVTLKDGTKIMTDGTVVMKDGSKGMLKNGEMYDMDGMKSMLDTSMAK
jgi:hypothetical protein